MDESERDEVEWVPSDCRGTLWLKIRGYCPAAIKITTGKNGESRYFIYEYWPHLCSFKHVGIVDDPDLEKLKLEMEEEYRPRA